MTRFCIAVLALNAVLYAQAPPPDARMMRGDDVRWADPKHDDSHWDLIAKKGLTRWQEWLENRLWIRSRIVIPESADQLALVVRFCLCEVYLNGVLVGALGDLSQPRPLNVSRVAVLWLPRDVEPGPRVLAIRHYLPPGYEVVAALWRYGHPQLVRSRDVPAALEGASRLWFQETAFLLSLVLTALLAGLWGQRFDQLSRLICAYLILSGLTSLLYMDWGREGTTVRAFLAIVAAAPLPAIVLAVMANLGNVPLRAWWWGPYLAVVVVPRALWMAGSWAARPPVWTPWASYLYLAPVVWAIGAGLWCLWKVEGKDWARRVLILAGLATLVLSLLARVAIGSVITAGGISQFGAVLAWDRLSNVVFGILAAVFLVRRARDRRTEESRMKSELAAARSVQSLLLGQSLPAEVEAVYVPASEVGGDFYQVWQNRNGTMLVIGDVAGKGLQAALTVATVVGAVRRSRDLMPGELLAALNEAMQQQGGFITCCCVLATPGELRIASAGHPSPYLDGVELALEAGLPLGVASGVIYNEVQVPRPRLLTLVSDGVLEAANASGELFGFERTRDSSSHPPKQIAEAARAWGQTDDITVIHLRRL
ncbi:MAG: serine/threonine-protein phosphatase [Bryobacterales bacterium]|nr:serine/threonine-protein phosphatase [Bryobacterales bacterium]